MRDHDPNWSNPQMKHPEEDSFIIPLPDGFYDAIHNFVFDCMQALEDTEYTYEDAQKSSNITEAFAGFKDTVDTIGELVIRLKYWKNGIHESKATHINGSDYWAVVNILAVIRHTLSTSSNYAQDKIYAHGNNYRINATNLYNAFVRADFAKGKASFMQPLYEEVKALREQS